MKLIVDHQAIKRQIDGAFEICGSGRDLLRLADCIKGAVEGGGGEHPELFYGWITVCDAVQSSPPNTPPREWTE